MACNHGLLSVCEIINGNESRRCLEQMFEDRKVFAWFIDLLFKHKNLLMKQRIWPVTLFYGVFRPLPLVYAYLNDVQIIDKQRTFRITFTDWQRHTYGVVDVTLDIYPQLQIEGYYCIKTEAKIVHKHICVMTPTVFGPTRTDFCKQVSNSLVELLWLLDECCQENIYDVVEIRKLMTRHNVSLLNNTMFSTRLIDVLMYAYRLQKEIRTYITTCCSCSFGVLSPTYCKCLFVCLTIRDRFPEANLLADGVVLFATPR